MFKKIFGRDEDEEEVFETVDPVLEQRRKEKFSTPLIYNDDDEKTEEKVVEKKEVIQRPTIAPVDTSYHMSEIISPMGGLLQSNKSKTVKVAKPKVKKIKKENDELIPIISPYYGPSTNVDIDEVDEKNVETHDNMFEDISVENNLRNIAHIVAEEKDQLKIIEERTGEFKLDFKNNDEETFIDEIDDTMSLDELMSLYENKFKD